MSYEPRPPYDPYAPAPLDDDPEPVFIEGQPSLLRRNLEGEPDTFYAELRERKAPFWGWSDNQTLFEEHLEWRFKWQLWSMGVVIVMALIGGCLSTCAPPPKPPPVVQMQPGMVVTPEGIAVPAGAE